MKTTPSRRSFLKLAAACTAPAFGSLAFAAPQTKQKFDKVADVIVIGSGFAGLAAALEAKEKGASVKKGDPIVVTEAMKMETTITAPIDGIISEIRVKAGQRIESGDLLMIK
jgi:biotin carboxyl carrier protein